MYEYRTVKYGGTCTHYVYQCFNVGGLEVAVPRQLPQKKFQAPTLNISPFI